MGKYWLPVIADVFEDFISPVTAAQTLLHSACKKRKDMLQKTMILLNNILSNPATEPAQRDGALHMVGTLADILLKRQVDTKHKLSVNDTIIFF